MKNSAFVFTILILITLFGCGNSQKPVEEPIRAPKAKEIAKPDEIKPAPKYAEASGTTNFVIHTDFGDMKGILYDATPLHRDNFVKLANEGFYNDLLFHRVIDGFMIQGGDPDSKAAVPNAVYGDGGPGYTIPAEIMMPLIHKKGALAAAREGDRTNPERASSGSQFYIVQGRQYGPEQLNSMIKRTNASYLPEQIDLYQTLGGTPFLDNKYTVFGEITEGLDVIDRIAKTETGANDRPVKDVKMVVEIVE